MKWELMEAPSQKAWVATAKVKSCLWRCRALGKQPVARTSQVPIHNFSNNPGETVVRPFEVEELRAGYLRVTHMPFHGKKNEDHVTTCHALA